MIRHAWAGGHGPGISPPGWSPVRWAGGCGLIRDGWGGRLSGAPLSRYAQDRVV